MPKSARIQKKEHKSRTSDETWGKDRKKKEAKVEQSQARVTRWHAAALDGYKQISNEVQEEIETKSFRRTDEKGRGSGKAWKQQRTVKKIQPKKTHQRR